MDEYDIVVIGCGPAGLSAAIFCGRAGLKTLVIGIPEKGQLESAKNIENYFGFPDGVSGAMLVDRGITQAQKFGVKILRDEVVLATPMDKKKFVIKTGKDENVGSRSIIITTGTPIRLSDIKNEEAFSGKGIHYYVSEGAKYKNKKIAVLGSSNHAAEDAIEAMSYTKNVTIISNAPAFEFSDAYDKEITNWKIKTVLAKVKEFKGEDRLESILMEDGREIEADAVFMACGTAGALDFAANLGLEIKDGLIVTDSNNRTSMEGVFAAGNCTGFSRQLAKNVGDGCNAAIGAIRYLRAAEVYTDYATEKSEVPIKREGNKLRVGWFSFSCCEDSTIVFTEILNDYYDKLTQIIDISYARVLRKKNDMRDLDIAFVEGAISNDKAAEELKQIRKNSKKLIAVGACAVTGMPSAQRNQFDERLQREIEPVVRAFNYSSKVMPLHEVVKVDDNVPGCPMQESNFIAVLNKCLKEFGINAQL